MSRDTLYQQVRGHLAYLKLGAAAEALPAQLDTALKTRPPTPSSSNGCWRSKSPRSRPAATPACCASPTSQHRGGWRTSTTPPSPPSTRH